jgi:sarcosine oxidase
LPVFDPSPGDSGRLQGAVTCLYSLTPDESFLVDVHPDHRQVVIAAGFSGHGFKFAPLMSLAPADLALEGTTAAPIDFLELDRLRG